MTVIRSFDPLGSTDPSLIATAIKQRVRNIIRSYNHPADLLAEPIQNAVDEIENAVSARVIERGHVTVRIDCATGKVSVKDNGRGIRVVDIEKQLAPDVTGKAELFRSGRSRGHKGVGLTFLAYGFNFFELESRTSDEHYRVRISNARQWVEDAAALVVPQAELVHLTDGEGELRTSGTVVTAQVSPQTEPRDLHRTFSTAEYATTVLEVQTAIGVFPKRANAGDPVVFDAQLDYIARDGTLSSKSLSTEYRFPHLNLKRGVRTIDVGAYLSSNHATTPPARLTRKHESAYRAYGTDQLVEMLRGRADRDLLSSDADVEGLLRKHKMTAYALAAYGAAYRNTLSGSWSVPSNRKLIAPSVRVATDGMISSWQRDLSLSHRGFNVERIWLVFHLHGVEPDMGRKDYPPEILELLAIAEDPIADDIARQGAPFLIPTSRGGGPIDYAEPLVKATQRRAEPLTVQLPEQLGAIGYLTEPREEQDVVALFNELRGLGILGYLHPVFFSGHYAYDSFLDYATDEVPDAVADHLPGNEGALVTRLKSGVGEFKFKAADLLPDLVREIKSWEEIRWLICWTAAAGTTTQGGLTMGLTEVEAGDSPYAGVTHLATLDAAGEKPIHVIALKSLVEKIAGT